MAQSFGIARCRDARGSVYPRSSIGLTPQPFVKPLQCDGRGCSAQVDAVRRHERNKSVVEAFYRLAKDARHELGCPFNVPAQLEEIRKLAAVETDGDIYRLNLEAVEKEPARPVIEPERAGDPRTPFNVTTDPDRVISPVLAAARDIVRLIQATGDDPDLIRRFRARMNDGTELTWNQFCWPAHRVDELVADIAQNPRRPRAVYGTLSDSRTTSGGTSRVLRLDTAPSTSKTAVHIRTKIVKLPDRYTRRGASILGLSVNWGKWSPPTAPPGPPLEVRMWAEDTRQFTTWEPS